MTLRSTSTLIKDWRLFNTKTGKQIAQLDLHSIVNFLSARPATELVYWGAWNPKMKDWAKVMDVPEIREKLRLLRAIPYSGEGPQVDDYHETVKLNSQTGEKADRRLFPRVEIRLKVVIVSGSKSFRGFTQDASLGGVLLENKIPFELSKKSCHVFLSSSDDEHAIEFRARIIADRDNPRRIAFEEANEKFKKRLQMWLQKTEVKKAA